MALCGSVILSVRVVCLKDPILVKLVLSWENVTSTPVLESLSRFCLRSRQMAKAQPTAWLRRSPCNHQLQRQDHHKCSRAWSAHKCLRLMTADNKPNDSFIFHPSCSLVNPLYKIYKFINYIIAFWSWIHLQWTVYYINMSNKIQIQCLIVQVLCHGHSKMLHLYLKNSTIFPMGNHNHEEREEIRSDYHRETFLS